MYKDIKIEGVHIIIRDNNVIGFYRRNDSGDVEMYTAKKANLEDIDKLMGCIEIEDMQEFRERADNNDLTNK